MKGESYEEFVDKFKRKKTTDDCYTPPEVYDVVLKWMKKEYDLNDDVKIIRPFYPDGDYERYEYPENCVVVDNPPFSILSKIIRFYNRNRIRFFLFSPAMTLLTNSDKASCIAVGGQVIYDNGANVNTSFITNLEKDCIARTAPDLRAEIERVNKELNNKELPKYKYPDNIVTASDLNKLSKYGISFNIPRTDAVKTGALKAQKKIGKGAFGDVLIVSDEIKRQAEEAKRQAEEAKRQAEEAKRQAFELSDDEMNIIQRLNNHEGH